MVGKSIWYVLQTRPAHEDKAARGLVARGFDPYAPVVYRRVPTGRRDDKGRKLTREIARPMFPGYIFVQFDAGDEKFAEVRIVPGITGYLKDEAGEPQAVPDVTMDLIAVSETEEFGRYLDEEERARRAALRASKRKRAPPEFKTGDDVRVVRGEWKDWIMKVSKADDLGRVVLLFHIFGRETKIHADQADLEVAGV